jgi:hypothetical protein
MKLANIVYDGFIDVPNGFVLTNNFDEIDKSKPTLIIGYNLVNKLFPDFDITKRQLNDNVYWTFRKNEKRDLFNRDIDWFIDFVYENLTSSLIYVFVDVLQYKPRVLIKLVRKMLTLTDVYSYEKNNMIYLCDGKYIFGIDLKLLNFVGLNIEKIKNKIKLISKEYIVDGDERFISTKLDVKDKYIPYMYSISNN